MAGSVERLSGTVSAFTFFLGTREVRGGSQTKFTSQTSSSQTFANLRNGRSVEAHGTLSGNVLTATDIHLEGTDEADDDHDSDNDDDDHDEQHEVEFSGRIQSIGGTIPNLTLAVSGHTVHTSSATVVRRHGTVVGLSALQLQQQVEVEGTLRSDQSVDAKKIEIEEQEQEAQEVELKGTISGLSPVSGCPSVTFTVSSQSVFTTSATEFRDVSCSGLTNGMRVEVKGTRETNGTVRAKRVERD